MPENCGLFPIVDMDEKLQLLAKLLVDHGLEDAFGVTGSGSSLALITELEALGVRYYPASHEASAALMAGAVCKLTGRISVSISIKGPGLANMLPGIVHNRFENNPALSISEAFGTEVPFYRKHKRLDHTALLSSVVKGIISLSDIERLLPILLDTARTEVPGPVHLDLCVKDTKQSARMDSNNHGILSLNQDVRKEVFQRLRNSERPVLLIGSLASRRIWRERLTSLSIPMFTTVSAKGVLDESLPYSAGVFTGDGKELAPESHLLAEADLVVGIGLRNAEVLSPKPFGSPTVMVDEVNNDSADGFQADVLLTGAGPDIIYDFLDELKSKSWGLERIDFLRHRMQKALLHAAWLPPVCFDILNHLNFPYALVLDAGSFCIVGEHLWQAAPDRFFISSSNGRSMGGAIPSALGAAIGKPGVPVFCVLGDGGMGMHSAEIKLAVQEKLPICFTFMTDGRYGSIACAPQPRPISRRAVTVFQPSWWRSIEAMGCEACAVDSEGSFAAAVQTWARRGPLFVEASFDPESYAAMTGRLR